MAGHPVEKKLYFVKRDTVKPSEELQKTIFPFIETSLQNAISSEQPTAIQFLNLLKSLRIIILQDVVFLKQYCPKHLIFKSELFNSEQFNLFEIQLMKSCEKIKAPIDLSIEQILPGIVRFI